MDSDEWSTSGEPAAAGSLLGWTVFLALVASLLAAEATVGFVGPIVLGLASPVQMWLVVTAVAAAVVAGRAASVARA
jgi:hypothetical protein